MNNLFCRPWFCLLTSSGRHLPLFLPRLSNNAVVFRCCCFSARGKLISCPPRLLPPRLHVSPVALVVFPMSVFLSVGAGFKIWSFLCSRPQPFYWILFLCLASHVLMKALFHQEVHTYKFIHLVVAENNFLCRYFCRLGPAFKYAVLSFLSGWGRSFTWFSPRIIILLLRFGFRVSLLNWAIYFPAVFVSDVSYRRCLTSSI